MPRIPGTSFPRRGTPWPIARPAVAVPGIIALIALVALSVLVAPRGRRDFFAVAVPASLQPAAVRSALAPLDSGEILDADSAMVALSDFSSVRLVPLSEAMRRVREGDPRSTPYLDALASAFRIRDAAGGEWQVLYIARSASAHPEAASRIG